MAAGSWPVSRAASGPAICRCCSCGPRWDAPVRPGGFELVSALEVRVDTPRSRHLRVSPDGEITTMAAPLHYRVCPGSLKVPHPVARANANRRPSLRPSLRARRSANRASSRRRRRHDRSEPHRGPGRSHPASPTQPVPSGSRLPAAASVSPDRRPRQSRCSALQHRRAACEPARRVRRFVARDLEPVSQD